MKAYPATQLCVSGDLKPLSPEAVVKSHKEGSSLPPLPADKNISCVHLNVQCQTEALCQNPCSLIGWLRFKMAVQSALPCLLTSKMADLPAAPPEAPRPSSTKGCLPISADIATVKRGIHIPDIPFLQVTMGLEPLVEHSQPA